MKKIASSSSIVPVKELRILTASAAALVAALLPAPQAGAQFISLTGSTNYTQNFDVRLGLGTSAWTDDSTIPGWHAGINSNSTGDGNVQESDGSVALSGLLNLGTTGATDRALGSKATSTNNFANIAFGVLFKNNSAFTLDITNISYVGELWRTNTTATTGLAEVWTTFTKISPTVFTDVEPGASSATANVGTFTAAPAALNWSSPTITPPGSPLNGNDPATLAVRTRSADPNLRVAPGEFFMFRWVDSNLGGTDGHQGIDEFSINFLELPNNLVYNLGHTVGGAPNGVLAVSPNQYWRLSGITPAGLATNDPIAFSEDITTGAGTATVTAPAAVTLATITLANTIGTYTLKTDANVTTTGLNGSVFGVGTPSQPLRKTGTAALVITGPSLGNAGIILDEGSIHLDSTVGGTLSGAISTTTGVLSTGGIVVTGTGATAAIIGGGALDTVGNTYVGTTFVGTTSPAATGNLVANKPTGTIAIPGDLIIAAGSSFRYSGNTIGNQIADASNVTIDGGSFGDVTAANTNPTNPGAAETVTSLTITANGGNFSSGRAVFTTNGPFTVLAGKALAHRAGTIAANSVAISGTGSIDVDGTSTTVGSESRLTVGPGGLTLIGGTINLNSHAGAPAAAAPFSVGSILTLNGDVVSTGTSQIVDQKTANMATSATTVDLGGADRAFDVTGTLAIGSGAAGIALSNGGVTKNGTGNLILTKSMTLNSLTINGGVVTFGAPPPSPAPGAEFGGDDLGGGGSPAAVPEPGTLGLLAAGAAGLLRRRRRA